MSINKVKTIEVKHVFSKSDKVQISKPFMKDVFKRSGGSISSKDDEKDYICHRGGCYIYTGKGRYTLRQDSRKFLIEVN